MSGAFSWYIQKYPICLGQKLRIILFSFFSSLPHQHLWVTVSTGTFTSSGIIKNCVVGNLNSLPFIIWCKLSKSIGLTEHDLGYDSRARKVYITGENKKKCDVQVAEWLHRIRGKSILMQQISNSSNTIFCRPDAQLVFNYKSADDLSWRFVPEKGISNYNTLPHIRLFIPLKRFFL